MITKTDAIEADSIARDFERAFPKVTHEPVKQFCSWCRRYYISNKENATIYVEPPPFNAVISHGGPCKPCKLKHFPQFAGRKSL